MVGIWLFSPRSRVSLACSSEILGETLFLALVEEAKTPRDRYQFQGTLLQLESVRRKQGCAHCYSSMACPWTR